MPSQLGVTRFTEVCVKSGSVRSGQRADPESVNPARAVSWAPAGIKYEGTSLKKEKEEEESVSSSGQTRSCVRVKTRRRRRPERVGTAGGGEVEQRFKKLGVTPLDSQECPCHDHIQVQPGHPLIPHRYGGRSSLGGGGAPGRGQAGPPHPGTPTGRGDTSRYF